MNDERDVRDLLTRVVPEAPAGDRFADLVRRRRSRRTQRAIAAGAGAVVMTIGMVAVIAGLNPGERTLGPAIDPVLDPDIAAQVYARGPCPEEMPAYDDLPTTLPDLSRITAVRFCTNPDQVRPMYQDPPSRAEILATATPDALVTGVSTFADGVDDLDDADPDRCAAFSIAAGGDALALELADGSQVLVGVDMCTDVRRADGSVIDGADLANTFWRGIDAQRSSYAYAGHREAPLSCRSAGEGPVRPNRETIVAAIQCPGGASEGVRLEAGPVAALDRAWRSATIDADPDTSREDPCLEPDEPPDHIVVRTDRGDTIRLLDSACGYLAWSTSFDGFVRYRIPTTGPALSG